MMVKTRELIGDQLDWAVATCEGYTDLRKNPHRFDSTLIMSPPRNEYGPVFLDDLDYSGDWSMGGPIIDREHIGKFDEDALGTYGPLSYDRALDMNHIATSTLKEIE